MDPPPLQYIFFNFVFISIIANPYNIRNQKGEGRIKETVEQGGGGEKRRGL